MREEMLLFGPDGIIMMFRRPSGGLRRPLEMMGTRDGEEVVAFSLVFGQAHPCVRNIRGGEEHLSVKAGQKCGKRYGDNNFLKVFLSPSLACLLTAYGTNVLGHSYHDSTFRGPYGTGVPLLFVLDVV